MSTLNGLCDVCEKRSYDEDRGCIYCGAKLCEECAKKCNKWGACENCAGMSYAGFMAAQGDWLR